MNTNRNLPRAAFLALALGMASATASFAQTTSTTPPTPAPGTAPAADGFKHHFNAGLTDAEQTELKNAHDAVMATNPDLKTQEAAFKQERESQNGTATEEQKHARFAQIREFRDKLRAAELKVDPNLVPVFAKIAAAHKAAHHDRGI